MKNTLLEEIKRIHSIIGIEPKILLKEEEEINEDAFSTELARIFAKFFVGVEKSLVVGGRNYAKAEVKAIVKKLGIEVLEVEEKEVVRELTKAAIAADRKIIANISSDIFGEMQKLGSKNAKTKYFAEVKTRINDILPPNEAKEVVKGVRDKIGSKKQTTSTNTTTNTTTNTGGKTSTGGKTNEFTIPDLDTDIPDVWKMGRDQTTAALKNRFPKAPSSDVAKMVNNLEKMKITDQAVFDRELKAAVEGYLPKYEKILNDPGNFAKFKASYETWPKVAKWAFWLTTSTVSYATLKSFGVPIDKWSNYVTRKLKEIFKDQGGGVIDGLTGNTTSSTTTTTPPPPAPTNVVDDSEAGLRNYFATKVEGYDRASADALQIKSLGSSRYEITKDGTKTIVIYSDGKFKRE